MDAEDKRKVFDFEFIKSNLKTTIVIVIIVFLIILILSLSSGNKYGQII